jgi:hypothetical protein
MDIRAVAFDVNGTLVRILTEDGMDQIFRSVAHFLTYQGIDVRRDQVRDLYFQIMKEQQRASPEEYPEFDAVGIWRSIIEQHLTDFTRTLPVGKLLLLFHEYFHGDNGAGLGQATRPAGAARSPASSSYSARPGPPRCCRAASPARPPVPAARDAPRMRTPNVFLISDMDSPGCR